MLGPFVAARGRTSQPHESQEPAITTRFILTLGVLARVGLISVVLATLWARTRFIGRAAQRLIDVALVLLAIASFCIWVNPGSIRNRTTFINWANIFHYYLGSKYFHEIGYFNIYGAAFLADAEEPPGYFHGIRITRDLRDYRIIRPESARSNPLLKDRFSPELWEAFRADLKYIQRGFPPERWEPILADHGNNAPPPQASLSGVIAKLLGPANASSIALLALLDPLLIALLLVVVYRVYGLRNAALLAIFFGMNELCESGYLIGAFLRLDWLVAAGLGICCLSERHYLRAGMFLGIATALRIFPVFFALAVVLRGGIEFARKGTWPSEQRRFLLGFALAGGALLLLSLGPHLELRIWTEFIDKIRLHNAVAELGAFNVVGLGQVFDESSIGLWLARGVMVLLFLGSLTRVNDVQAAILGSVLVFALLTIADYYYAFLCLFFLWQPVDRMDGRWLLFIGMLFASVSILFAVIRALAVPIEAHHPAASLALLVTFAVLFADMRLPRTQAGV